MKWRSEKMNVLLTSKPSAMMSLAFSLASRIVSSILRSFHRNFSSSVSWMTSGTSNTSCNHLHSKQDPCFIIESLLTLQLHTVLQLDSGFFSRTNFSEPIDMLHFHLKMQNLPKKASANISKLDNDRKFS